MCLNSSNVHWLPTVLEFQWKWGHLLCGFVHERNHWIVPTHLQALRVQLLVVSEDFGVCTSRPDLCSPDLSLQSSPTSFIPVLLI